MAIWRLSGLVLSRFILAPLGVLFIMKTLEDERWGVITAHNLSCFGDFEKFVFISIYCVSALSLHIDSTNSMIGSNFMVVYYNPSDIQRSHTISDNLNFV